MSVNKWIGIGRVGKKPEISYTPNGKQIAKFSLATDEKWIDKKSGEKKSSTSWHRITLFEKLASIAEQYVDKGSLLYIEGRLSYGSYEKDGQTIYTMDIIGSQMQMLSGRDSSDSTKSAPAASAQGKDEPF